jgi:hypothetical protein
MSVSLCYCITECRDVCGIETKFWEAGMVVALLRSYWEQGWLWHSNGVTGSRDGCGTVTELLGAGIIVAL